VSVFRRKEERENILWWAVERASFYPNRSNLYYVLGF
jgi:hypothetical protein